jgi:hypothetical protein
MAKICVLFAALLFGGHAIHCALFCASGWIGRPVQSRWSYRLLLAARSMSLEEVLAPRRSEVLGRQLLSKT